MATGITMYSTTEVSSVSHGTVMADTPAKTPPAVQGQHHDAVVQRHLRQGEQRVAPVRRLHTNTMAVCTARLPAG